MAWGDDRTSTTSRALLGASFKRTPSRVCLAQEGVCVFGPIHGELAQMRKRPWYPPFASEDPAVGEDDSNAV